MTAAGQRWQGMTTAQVVDEVKRHKSGVSKVNREVEQAQKWEKDLFATLGGETGEAAEQPVEEPEEAPAAQTLDQPDDP